MRVVAAVDGSEPSLRACRKVVKLLAGRRAEVRLLVVLSFDVFPGALSGGPAGDTYEQAGMVRQAVERATAEPSARVHGRGP